MKTKSIIARFFSRAKFVTSFMALSVCGLVLTTTQAHVTYSGRDFGSYSGLTNETTSITNQTVTGNYGWADAADGVLGDSHRGRAFRFHLENSAYVSLTVAANPKATTNSLGGFTPAFSVYSGLAAIAPFPASQTTNPPSADHDFSASSVAWRIWWVQQNLDPAAIDETATDGSWNAVGDWKIGGDGDIAGDFSQLSSFIYKGSAASTTSGGSVTGSFSLAAGDYTIFIGGNDIGNKIADTALSPHGISATLSISPTPFVSIAAKVFVALPTGSPGNWTPESAPSLTAPNWTPVRFAPIAVDGQRGVLLDSGAASQFFRLRSNP
jgi:hypothetical protein